MFSKEVEILFCGWVALDGDHENADKGGDGENSVRSGGQ